MPLLPLQGWAPVMPPPQWMYGPPQLLPQQHMPGPMSPQGPMAGPFLQQQGPPPQPRALEEGLGARLPWGALC